MKGVFVIGKIRDLKGIRFERLLVLEIADRPITSKQDKAFWLCVCDCGKEIVTTGVNLTLGKTKSCGCLRSETTSSRTKTHGLSKTRYYRIYKGMNGRCYDEKDNEYKNYGAKGISLSDEWLTFENFMNDTYDDYLAFEEIHGKDSATIDRIDSKGNYCKENCRWQTQQEQARNRSDNISIVIDGVEYATLTEVAEVYDLNYQTVADRYRKGKRESDLISPIKFKGNTTKRGGIKVEVDGVLYDSLTELQRAYPHISIVSISKRYKKGKRDLELIS